MERIELLTILKARKILFNNDIFVVAGSTKNITEFMVKQATGNTWCNVWRAEDHRGVRWSCNAVIRKKNGSSYGCVMYTGDYSKPFCSHTLAASRKYEKLKESLCEELTLRK